MDEDEASQAGATPEDVAAAIVERIDHQILQKLLELTSDLADFRRWMEGRLRGLEDGLDDLKKT